MQMRLDETGRDQPSAGVAFLGVSAEPRFDRNYLPGSNAKVDQTARMRGDTCVANYEIDHLLIGIAWPKMTAKHKQKRERIVYNSPH